MYFNTDTITNLKDKLLLCAINEFAEYGYEGARIDNIVNAADCSKQTLYHHYGNKEKLFIAVIEYSWNDIRTKEMAVKLTEGDPKGNLSKLIDFTWDYYIHNMWFLKIVNTENQNKGEHLKKSLKIKEINKNHLSIMDQIVLEGKKLNIFRKDIIPVHVNISIAALGFYYLINQHTLGFIYNMEMASKENLDQRHVIIKDTITRWVSV